jgi:hypothetical protein
MNTCASEASRGCHAIIILAPIAVPQKKPHANNCSSEPMFHRENMQLYRFLMARITNQNFFYF